MSCIIKNGKYYDSKGVESKLYKDLAEKVGEQEAHSLFVLSHTPTFLKNAANIDSAAKTFTTDSTKVFFTEKPKTITLELIETEELDRGKGKAKYAIQQLINYADSKGKTIELFASPRDKKTNENKLIKFYKSFGFTSKDEFLPQEMSRRPKTNNNSVDVKITSNFLDRNGEPKAEVVLKYSQDNFSLVETLTQEEILDIATLQIKDVETSDELYDVLYDTFYKNGIFEPQLKKMQKIYTEEEIRTILEDVEIQARIKETVEKLRHTEEFNITQIEYDKDFSYKDLVINIIGQYKSNNPLQDKQIYEQKNGGEGFVEVKVINEDGEPIQEKLIYDNAVKVIKDPKILQAIDAIIQAPQIVDTTKLENKVTKWLLDYGLNIEALSRENYRTLAEFIRTPTEENTILLEQSLGFERSPRKEFIKITPENRTYQTLKTTKTEQELFDELSLIKTNTPNVYQKVNKIDEQEIRDAVDNQDLTVPIYELYREYFDYGLKGEITKIKEQTIADGTFMKAPNGKPTNLSEDNWLFVRTQAFKNWFGDFENSPETSSKVVDENGEPLVVYHGTNNKFTEFKKLEGANRKSKMQLLFGNHFATLKKDAELYTKKDNILNSFLNPKNPINLSVGYVSKNDKDFEKWLQVANELNIVKKNKNTFDYTLFTENGDYGGKSNEVERVFISANTLDEIAPNKVFTALLNAGFDGVIYTPYQPQGFNQYTEFSKSYITFNPNQIKSAENTRAQIEQDSNDIRYFKKPSNVKPIQTNIQTDIDYLTDEFIADFAAEKLKNTNNEFYQQFKITENGIELISNDEITLAKVKSQINDYQKLADYSLISKMLPNLKDAAKTFEDKSDRRVKAINNKQSIPQPKTEVEIIDDQFIKAPNETSEWLKIGDNVYEQQEEGIYSKLDFEEDANYYTFKVDAPPYKVFEQKETKIAEKTIKKLTDKKTDSENFDCL